MKSTNYNPLLTRHLVEEKIFANDPFFLVDVGASGGIDSCWNAFSPSFKAIGFDPLVVACERLNVDPNKLPSVVYESCFITGEDPLVRSQSHEQYSCRMMTRSSAWWATELQRYTSAKAYQGGTEQVVFSDKKISLNCYFSSADVKTIDFIKVDTDGYDYEVLHGAQAILQNKQVLGLLVESQFHGGVGPHSNTFRNIDRLLTESGFSLFDLEVNRYTKRALPGKFCYSIPAQTTTGQVLWGDALYFRDPVISKDHPSGVNLDLSSTQILKLASLFEIFGIPDSAADLLIHFREKLMSVIDVKKCLDLLTKNVGVESSYKKYIRSFETDLSSFYPNQVEKVVEKYLSKDIPLKTVFSTLLRKAFS